MPAFAAARRELTVPRPNVPQLVATHGDMAHAVGSMSGNLGYATRLQGQTRHYFGYRDIKWFALVFPGYAWSGGDALPNNDLPIRVAVNIPSAPIPTVRVTFEAGRKAVDVQTGAIVDQGLIPSGAAEFVSDRLTPEMFGYTGGVIPANAMFLVRTLQDFAVGQQNYNSVGPDVLESVEYNQYGRSDTMTDGTMTGSISGTLGSGGGGGNSKIWQGIKPIAIIGEPVAPMMAVAAIGDSIMQGPGGGPAGPYPNVQVGGYFSNALFDVNGHHVPHMNLATQGTLGAQWDANTTRARELLKYATHVISEHGSNDGAPTSLLPVLQRNLLDAKSRGLCKHATQALITYRATSTDNWATLVNQTVSLNPSALNALIVAAKGKGIIDEVIDVPGSWASAPAPFTPSDGTKFPVTGTALDPTADGTHPSQNLARVVMRPAYKAWALARLMEQVSQKPLSVTAPSVIGPRVQGQALLCLSGAWGRGECAYQTLAYQWFRGAPGSGTAIASATSQSYTTTASDAAGVYCVVTAANPVGSTSVSTAATGALAASASPGAFPASGALVSFANGQGQAGSAGLSFTGGQSDPAGGTGASKLAFSTTGNTLRTALASANIVDGQQYTASVYAKAAEYSVLFLNVSSGSTSWGYTFNLATGAIDANAFAGLVQTIADQVGITPMSNGWYRCFVTYTAIGALSGNTAMRWGPSSAVGSQNGNGAAGSGILAFRVQLALGTIDA